MTSQSASTLRSMIHQKILSWDSFLVGLRANTAFIQKDLFDFVTDFVEAENAQLKAELAQCQQDKADVVSVCTRLQIDNGKLKTDLTQSTQREARLREALAEIVDKCEDEDWEYMFGDIIARAKQALEEAAT